MKDGFEDVLLLVFAQPYSYQKTDFLGGTVFFIAWIKN